MGCWVTEALDLVVRSGDDLPAADDDSTDGYFTRFVGQGCLIEGLAHEVFVRVGEDGTHHCISASSKRKGALRSCSVMTSAMMTSRIQPVRLAIRRLSQWSMIALYSRSLRVSVRRCVRRRRGRGGKARFLAMAC